MSNYKILLVEDALHWRKILNNYINTAINNLAGNAHISEAESLEQAWDMLENDRWDLLCTDIGLSKTAGATEGALLVSRASEKNIPTIIISGTPSVTPKHVRDFLKEDKVADFLYKQTFNSLDFVQLVEKLLYSNNKLEKSTQKIIIFYSKYNFKEVSKLKDDLFSRFGLTNSNTIIEYFNEILKDNHEWHKSIAQSSENITSVLLILSADFIASHADESSVLPVLVKNIISTGKKVIPVCISPCDIYLAKKIFGLYNINIIEYAAVTKEIPNQEMLLDDLINQIWNALNDNLDISK